MTYSPTLRCPLPPFLAFTSPPAPGMHASGVCPSAEQAQQAGGGVCGPAAMAAGLRRGEAGFWGRARRWGHARSGRGAGLHDAARALPALPRLHAAQAPGAVTSTCRRHPPPLDPCLDRTEYVVSRFGFRHPEGIVCWLGFGSTGGPSYATHFSCVVSATGRAGQLVHRVYLTSHSRIGMVESGVCN